MIKFFLGGHDLEMLAIAELASAEGLPVHDKRLGWGARASAYRAEIDTALAAGRTPVLVELIDDLGLASRGAILVDHHGDAAGADKPTSLRQVFDLLGLPEERWSRRLALVAANDRGYIPEMIAVGASRGEIAEVRAQDRAAQGITAEQEAAGQRAAAQAQNLCGGRLTVAHLPHPRCAVVTDRLDAALGGPGYVNLLVVSPAEVNFFGAGELVRELERTFPGGWYGGALPLRGFWGGRAQSGEVLDLLRDLLEGRPRAVAGC